MQNRKYNNFNSSPQPNNYSQQGGIVREGYPRNPNMNMNNGYMGQHRQNQNYNGYRESKNLQDTRNSSYDLNTLQQLIDYIYSTVELSRFKYKILEYENELVQLTREKFYASANFSGMSCLLIFTKLRDKFYSFLVDRRTLSYNKTQIKLDAIKTIGVNIRLDNSIYNGTIMDGIYVQNKRTHSNTFIMTDIYQFRGENMINDNLPHKIMNVTGYLKANLKQDDKMNNISLTVNILYEPTDLPLLKADMEKSKGFDIKGIVFYPEKSGQRLIIMDNKDPKHPTIQPQVEHVSAPTKTNQVNTTNMLQQCGIREKKRSYKYICKTDEPVFMTLEVRKTESPDVYLLFCSEKLTGDGGRTIIKIKKIGIALIPTIECSTKCRNLLNSKQNGKALMKCRFDSDKSKWIPLEEDKNKRLPALQSEMEKYLDIVVDSDSED